MVYLELFALLSNIKVLKATNYLNRYTVANLMLGRCILTGHGIFSRCTETSDLGKNLRKHG